MLTTNQILDLIKEKYDLSSDYQLHKFANWSHSTISGYRNKPQYMSEGHAVQAAQLLDLPEGFILACVHAERAKVKAVKSAWENTAALLAPENSKNADDYILCKIAERPQNLIFAQYPLDLTVFPQNVTRLHPKKHATKCRQADFTLQTVAQKV